MKGDLANRKNRSRSIQGRNMGSVIITVCAESCVYPGLPVFDSSRTRVTELVLFNMMEREKKKRTWNMCLHSRDNHPREALGTHKGVLGLEAILITRVIRKIHSKGPSTVK